MLQSVFCRVQSLAKSAVFCHRPNIRLLTQWLPISLWALELDWQALSITVKHRCGPSSLTGFCGMRFISYRKECSDRSATLKHIFEGFFQSARHEPGLRGCVDHFHELLSYLRLYRLVQLCEKPYKSYLDWDECDTLRNCAVIWLSWTEMCLHMMYWNPLQSNRNQFI